MVEKDKIVIHIKDAFLNLFLFKKKPILSKTAEDWESKTYIEQIQEFRDMLEYHEHIWLKYYFLRDVVKWIIFTSIFWLIIIFGISINCLIFGLIINLLLTILFIYLNNKAIDYWREARSDWFFMNEMLNKY